MNTNIRSMKNQMPLLCCQAAQGRPKRRLKLYRGCGCKRLWRYHAKLALYHSGLTKSASASFKDMRKFPRKTRVRKDVPAPDDPVRGVMPCGDLAALAASRCDWTYSPMTERGTPPQFAAKQEEDHVHVLVHCPPKLSIAKQVNRLKDVSNRNPA